MMSEQITVAAQDDSPAADGNQRDGNFHTGKIEYLGYALRRRQDVVRTIQWSFVLLYFFLLVGPVLLPIEIPQAGVLDNLTRFSEVIFWGIWWPGVILATMIFGQFWCGVLCPDGALTEAASRNGLGGKIPPFLRHAGWPLLIFSLLTIAEYLLDAHRSSVLTLIFIGGCSALAVIAGWLFARGKRIWCRYLCPLGGIFSLLARCALVHIRVNKLIWNAAPKPLLQAVDCPLLLDVRNLKSNEKCNMCGRCIGHRNAVVLASRPLGMEFTGMRDNEIRTWEALGIIFVLIGLTYGAIHWKESFWYAQIIAAIPTFNGSVALASLAAILLPALVIGGISFMLLLASAAGNRSHACRLAYALIPLGGLGLFLGAIEHSLEILQSEGWHVASGLTWLRGTVLLVALLWTGRIGWLIMQTEAARFKPSFFLISIVLLALAYQFAPNPFHV